LNPEMLSARPNMQDWEVDQMNNLRFVAITRHKLRLTMVADRVRENAPKLASEESAPKTAKPSRKRKAQS
jgi:hypothetical protein